MYEALLPTRRLLTRQRTLQLLDELQGREGITVYFKLGADGVALEKVVCLSTGLSVPPRGFGEAVSSSRTGGVIFWTAKGGFLVIPPFHLDQEFVADGIDIMPLRLLLQQELTIALVIVRLGEYGIGVFHGERRLSSKIGTGLVHARHRQGGSSAHRFERHREKQMETFFTRVCTHAREQIEPYHRDLDYVIYGGERHTLLAFREQCQFLQQYDSQTPDMLLDVRRPRQTSVEEAIVRVWSSTVLQWMPPHAAQV